MTSFSRPRVADVLAMESLPIVVCSLLVGLLALLVPHALAADGWLALVDGRLIAHDGLPHHDVLAALTTGREWVDQQWLGQLAEYAVWLLGGIRLVLLVNVVLVASGFVAAAAVARLRGAESTTVAIVALFVLVPFAVTAANVRTQSFAYLPLVGIVALLARREGPSPARIAIVFALLVLWANVHGSALFAAALVALRGFTNVLTRRRNATSWLLVVCPWFTLLASPYHVHLVSYYAHTAFNPAFSSYLSQWEPTALSPLSAPLLILLFATAWMLGRSGGGYPLYERSVLVVAIVLALLAVRNWAFASLLFIALAPEGFDRALRKRLPARPPAIGAVIGAGAALAATAGAVAALAAPASHLTRDYRAAAADAVARAAGPRSVVYAGIPLADWLLWSRPELAGRVVFDVRYELLHADEVKRLVLFDAGSGTDRPLGRPAAYLLDPSVEGRALEGIRPGVRIIYKTDHAVVAVARDVR